jgi:hypothetical protein
MTPTLSKLSRPGAGENRVDVVAARALRRKHPRRRSRLDPPAANARRSAQARHAALHGKQLFNGEQTRIAVTWYGVTVSYVPSAAQPFWSAMVKVAPGIRVVWYWV